MLPGVQGSRATMRRIAAALERGSQHPLASAFRAHDDGREATLAASVRWHAASAIRTAERQLAAGATAAAAATLRAIPDILDVLDGRAVQGVATRRLASLRARLRDEPILRRVA